MGLFDTNNATTQQLIENSRARNMALAKSAQANASNQRDSQNALFGTQIGANLATGLMRKYGFDEEYNQAIGREKGQADYKEGRSKILGQTGATPAVRENVTTPQGGIRTNEVSPASQLPQHELTLKMAQEMQAHGAKFGSDKALVHADQLRARALQEKQAFDKGQGVEAGALALEDVGASKNVIDAYKGGALELESTLKNLTPEKKDATKNKIEMYKEFTTDSVKAFLKDPSQPLIPRDKGKTSGVGSGAAVFGKINTSLHTPESLGEFQQVIATTGVKDYSLLKPVDASTAAGQAEQAKLAVQGVAERNDKFTSAVLMNSKVQQMSNILRDGLDTGTGRTTIVAAKKALSLVTGQDYEGVAEAEVFGALSNQLALAIRNPDSGMGLPGATSNRDIQFLIDSIASLDKTREGNAKILGFYGKMFEFQKAVMAEQTRIIKEDGINGVPPSDINSRLAEFGSNYQMFTEAERGNVPAKPATSGGLDEDALNYYNRVN